MDTVFSTQSVHAPYLAAKDLFVLVPYIAHGVLSIAPIDVFVQLCSSFNGSINVHLKRTVIDLFLCPCAFVRSFN